ncbi:MAG: hypothetical protein WCC41_17430 [Rhodomicrobium sp.]
MVEHRFRSISYAAPNRVRARGPEAFRNQGGVRRVDEIGRSIGYRPIQVENDCGTVNGLLPRILSAMAPTLSANKLFRRIRAYRSFATKSSHVLANPRQN